MKWAGLSQREKVLAMVTAGCILMTSAGQWGWSFIAGRLNTYDQEALRLTKEIKISQDFLRRHGAVEAELKKASQDFIESSDQDLMAQMLAALQTEAQAGNLHLQEINSLPFEQEGGIRMLKVKMAVTGSWPELIYFLNQIQKPPRRFDIEELVLKRSAETTALIHCQMTLRRWSVSDEAAP
jgi:Tfp pilus assembly protein PilO